MANELELKINLDNLSDDEREQFIKLVEKSSKPNTSTSSVWKPEMGDEYYGIDSSGPIAYTWYDDMTDNYCYAIGNCFKTKEEADFMVEKLKVIAELKRFAEEHNTEINWNEDNQFKYFLYYNYVTSDIFVGDNQFSKRAITYFSSKEIAHKAIDAIGADRLKKYYFEVKEND